MRKLFFTICFISFLTAPIALNAEITPIVGRPGAQNHQPKLLTGRDAIPSGMPNPNNPEEVRNFFKKRFEEATRTPMSDDIDWSNAAGIDVIHTEEYYKAKEEESKPLFQKMYEKALAALHEDNSEAQKESEAQQQLAIDKEIAASATRFFTIANQDAQPQEPQIPTVSFPLPSGRRVLAPAREHIPYFLSYLEIQANGYIKAEDTIVIVANNRKFSHGLTRMFPKYAQKGQRIDFILDSVIVNGTKVPYSIEEIGNNIVLKPKFNHTLEPGVYTYKFNYIVSNKLLRQDKDLLLEWNLTGRPLNAFVTSANVILSVPDGHSIEDALAIVGRSNRYSDRRTNVFPLASNVIALSNTTPLFSGENMLVIAQMNQNIFIKDFDKNFSYFLTNWGYIVYAVIGLLAILLSFTVSLLTLKKDRKKNRFTPSYNGALMRSILVNKYDRTAFVAQLLDLFRKNCIDITSEDNRIMLLRRQELPTKTTKTDKRALRVLFAKKRQLEVNNANNLILKKAKSIFEKNVNKTIKKYNMIHNIGYILSGCAMLLLTAGFISYISVNFAQTLIIILSTVILYAFYVWILRHRFKHWYTTLPIKLFALISIVLVWMFSSIYIDGITSLIFLAAVVVIFVFAKIFGEQNNFINEAKDTISAYKEYLVGNADAINLSRDFLNQQANIVALGIEEYFPQNASNKTFYKLDTAEELKNMLIGIVN